MKLIIVTCGIFRSSVTKQEKAMREIVNLCGEWQMRFCDGECMTEGFEDTIILPDTTSNAKKGKLNPKREKGHLTDIYKFEGSCAFRRVITLPKLEAGETGILHLERTRITKLFIDSESCGMRDSLCTSHNYDITRFCDGKEHEIIIEVSNVGYKTRGGHMTSPDTQTNWLGITGRMEVQCFGKVYAKNLVVTPDVEGKAFVVECDIVGSECGSVCVKASCGDDVHLVEAEFSAGKLSVHIPLRENAKLWSEFERNLYDISVDTGCDLQTVTAGLRKLSVNGNKFEINGRKTFLRGKHDGLIFPETGYAPTDKKSWLKVMETAKQYGINHYRFHTCCPPEAAFEAADELGIYMEPELPFWGSICAKDEEGYNEQEQEYLISEGIAILREFGNHPSFCMMSMGNELWGNRQRINEIMGILRSFDSRPLYTEGSNTFQFVPDTVENDDFFCGVRLSRERLIRGSYAMCDAPLGHVQTDEPSTLKDYDSIISGQLPDSLKGNITPDGTIQIQYGTGVKTVKASDMTDGFNPKMPIVTHEIGQYETYPDYNEIEKYKGPLRARNFEIFRERLCDKGLGELANDYFAASGKLAMACYKEELEAVLRSKLLAGCQILDIQDFSGQGTALVGVLNAFMENKGIISDSEWREFFSETVLLARFDRYVYRGSDSFKAKVQLCDYSDKSLCGKTLRWSLGKHSGEMQIGEYENYCDIGDIEIDCLNEQEGKLTLALSVGDIKNHYDLYVVKTVDSVDFTGCIIVRELDEQTENALNEGKTVLLCAKPDEDKSIEGFYCQDFWCYPMFRSISESMGRKVPVGTMGLLIDKSHPALGGFVTESYSTPQWWKAVSHSRSEILDNNADGVKVIVRTIDNFERNHNLGLIYEYNKGNGKVVVCNVDLEAIAFSPEGRALAQSLADYTRN